MALKTDEFAAANGHPPAAAGVICVDLDGTIIPWGPLTEVRDAFPGVRGAMQHLKDAGYQIVIFTSRLSPSWWKHEATLRNIDMQAFGTTQVNHVHEILKAAGIPYDAITSEKIPALAYFDDKAIQISQHYPLDRAIENWIILNHKAEA